jgi:hypothetical protein
VLYVRSQLTLLEQLWNQAQLRLVRFDTDECSYAKVERYQDTVSKERDAEVVSNAQCLNYLGICLRRIQKKSLDPLK